MIKMALKFLNILKKNFQFFWNNKLSSLIFLLGPLILILIIGAAVQDISVKNINAGLYVSESGLNIDSFIEKLNKRSFNIQIENFLEACKNNVKKGNSHVCIELKKSLISGLSEDYPNYDVKIYVDFSKQRIVWNIIGKIQGIVDDESYNARNFLITNLKEDNEKFIRTIQSRESEIDFAISNLQNLDENLNSISEKELLINSELEQINQNISQIVQNLNDIKSRVPLSGIYLTYLENAVSKLENVNQRILILQNSSSSFEDTKTYIIVIENNLENAKISLEEVRSNLEQLNEKNLERISNPIYLEYESVEGNEEGIIKNPLEFLDYLFPSFLIFFILFNATIFSSVIRIRERKSGAYIRNISSKVSGFNFVLGDILTSLIFAIAQIFIIIGVANFFLNINLFSNISSLISILLIITTIFILIGIAIGSIFKTQEATIITAVCISLLFFIFSSMIVPIEILPGILSQIAGLLPLTLLETKLRLILIFSSSLHFSLSEIASLIGTGIISVILTFLFYHKSKEKEI